MLRLTNSTPDRAPVPQSQLDDLASDLELLAHPVRLRIIELLARSRDALAVTELEAALPIRQPTVSHHLRILRDGGLVSVERDGIWALYALDRAKLSELRAEMTKRLDALA